MRLRHAPLAEPVLLVTMSLFAGPAGCYYAIREQRVQRIEVRTQPPGALIAVSDEDGVHPQGPAPVLIEQRYTAVIKRFRRWNWLWPALFAAGVGAGIGIWARTEDEVAGLQMTLLSVLGLTITTVSMALCEKQSGRVASTEPAAVMVGVTPPGGKTVEHRIQLAREGPAAWGRWVSTIRLAGVGPGSAPALPPLEPGTRLAVFAVDDQSGLFPAAVLARLEQRLVAGLAQRAMKVVPREQILAAVTIGGTRLKCFPGTCHREVGRKLQARKTLWTRLQRHGERCAIITGVYPLWSSAPERSALAMTDCTPASLLEGMDRIGRALASSP